MEQTGVDERKNNLVIFSFLGHGSEKPILQISTWFIHKSTAMSYLKK